MKEKIKHLIGNSVFDTARNVYHVLLLSKELGKAPEELVGSIHQVSDVGMADKRFAKYLFVTLVDCPSRDEQVSLIELLFKHYADTKDSIVSLAYALNDLELWHI